MGSIKVKQHDSRDCGAACLASVGNYFGVQLPVARIRQLAGTDQSGTNILGLVEAADQMGLIAKGVRTSINMLSEIPLPAIAHIIKDSDQHHYVVIYAISQKGLRVMDPASGKLETWKRSEFQKQWSEVLVIFRKKKDFHQINETASKDRKSVV